MAVNQFNEKDVAKLQSRSKHSVTASNSVGNLVKTTELNKLRDSTPETITNGTKVIRKMILLDPDKLKHFGLDMKIKNAVSQNTVDPSDSIAYTPAANRTIKLVQKVKLTPALSSKRAEKIPGTSINLNLLQQQISTKLQINRSPSSSYINQTSKSPQTIKTSPTTINKPTGGGMNSSRIIKIVKIIPKGENPGLSEVVHDSDNNFKGWSDDTKDPVGLIRYSNKNAGSPILQTTAKRLSDVIKSKSNSKIKQDLRIDAVTVQNRVVLNSHDSKSPDRTSHRVAPKQIEVSKMVKTPESVKNVFTIQGTIEDHTRPPSITYDINRIPTCSRESIDDRNSTPMRVPSQLRSSDHSNKSMGYTTPDNRSSSSDVEFKSRGKKPQKMWSTFNKFKKRNKKLKMENEELKNRLFSLMENMKNTNSSHSQNHIALEEITSPLRLQPVNPQGNPAIPIHLEALPKSEDLPRTNTESKILPILESTPVCDQDDSPIEKLQVTPRLRGKKKIPNLVANNHQITNYFSPEPAREIIDESIKKDANKNSLDDCKSVISERIESPLLEVSVITTDHGKAIMVPDIAGELELNDVDYNVMEQNSNIEFFSESERVCDEENDFNVGEGDDDLKLEMNISIDSSRDHDYSLPDKNSPTEIPNMETEIQEVESIVSVTENSISVPEITTKSNQIVIIENRLLTVKTQQNSSLESQPSDCSNIMAQDLIIDQDDNEFSEQSAKSTTPIVIEPPVEEEIALSENSQKLGYETNLSIDTDEFDDNYIEPPTYSPIAPVEISINSLKQDREHTEVETRTIPNINVDNIPVATDEIETIPAEEFTEPHGDEASENQNTSNEILSNEVSNPIASCIEPSFETHRNKARNAKNSRKKSKSQPSHIKEDVPELLKPLRTYSSNRNKKVSDLDSTEDLDSTKIKQEPDSTPLNTLNTRSRRQRKRIPSPEVPEIPIPLPTTRSRRRTRKSISPIPNYDTTPIATKDIVVEKRVEKQRIKSAPRKRIKIEETIEATLSDGDEFLGFPDNITVPVPIQEIKVEIKSEPQSDPDVSTDTVVKNSKSSKLGKTVICGNCKESMPTKSWSAHLRKHNGLGFREGFDTPIDFTDSRGTLNVMIYYMKMQKLNQVICEKCGTSRKSALGLMSHLQICGLSEEEQRVACVHCGNRLLPMSIQHHTENTCTVLKQKEIIEFMKKKESEPDLEEEEEVMDVTQSGRAKRKSVKAAEKKIKNFIDLIDDINLENHYTEKKPLKISGGTKRGWSCQLQNTGIIKCRIKTCDYTSDSLQEMSFHAASCRNIDEIYGFYCRHCTFYSLTCEPMTEHITKEHGSLLTKMNSLECVSGSEASAGEESSESDGSSGEDELECDDGNDDADNYGEMLDEDGNETIRMRLMTSVGGSSGGGSEYKNTETADALLRDYSLLIKQPQMTSSFYHFAFRWTIDFIAKYFSCDPLYTHLHPKIKSYISESVAEEYMPKSKLSPKFVFRMEKGYEADCTKLAIKAHTDDWEHLKRFTGKFKQKHNILLYCGGPILCLDWATFPVSYKDNQYLAVSCYHDYNELTQSNDLHGKKGLIQLWDVGSLAKNEAPIMKYAFKVDSGPVFDIKFCPSGGYVSGERIGLLAVTSLVGDVNIYSLPFDLDEKETSNIIELEPSVTLRPCVNDITYCRQAYRLSWTKDKEHSIIASGYTDGWVAIWNLKTESKLLKQNINGRLTILPTKIFHPFSATIRGLELFHVNNSQWLMVAADKNVKLYDLKTYVYPHEVSNVYQKSAITCTAWSIHWPGYLLGLNESFCLLRNSVTFTQPHEIGYKNYPMQSFDATVTDIAVSDFLNAYVAGTDSGDIISYLPRDLLLNISRKGNRRIKLILGFTDAIDFNVEQNSDIPSKFGVVFCDLAEPVLSSLNDLKSKRHRRWSLDQYPIVSITRIKFNPNQHFHKYYALGMQAGFVRIRYIMPRSGCYN